MSKKYETDKEWFFAAVLAIEDLPPRVDKTKALRLIELWNDRVPEFFRNRENPENANSIAGCGRCVSRIKEVFEMRFELLAKQFSAEEQPKAEKEVVAPPKPSKKKK